MSTYPSSQVPYSEGSYFELLNGTRIDRADNGVTKAQRLYSDDKRIFHIKHKYISPAKQALIDDFYYWNKTSSFDLEWVTYRCWEFDGSTSETFDSNTDFTLSAAQYTMEGTFYMTELASVAGASFIIASLRYSGSNVARLYIPSDNDYFYISHRQSDGTWIYASYHTAVALNSMHNVKMVADGSNIKLYVDGTLQDTTAYDNTLYGGLTPLRLHKDNTKGKVRQLKFTDDAGVLLCHYPAAEGSGAVAKDESGNGNDGVITSTAHGTMKDKHTVIFAKPPQYHPYTFDKRVDAEVILMEV